MNTRNLLQFMRRNTRPYSNGGRRNGFDALTHPILGPLLYVGSLYSAAMLGLGLGYLTVTYPEERRWRREMAEEQAREERRRKEAEESMAKLRKEHEEARARGECWIDLDRPGCEEVKHEIQKHKRGMGW